MTRLRFALSAAAALAFAAPLAAQAQYNINIGGGGGGGGDSVTCESQDGNYRESRGRFANAPVLVENLSSTPCVEGRNWGSRGPGSVWVSGGCRGRFADAYYGGGGGGYNPGYQQGGYGDVIRCESDDGRHRECRTGTRGRVALVRQLSESPCIEGQTWGSNRNGTVWVRQGCRGEFAAGGYGGGYNPGYNGGYAPGYQGGNSNYTITCESQDRRYSSCHWDARWGYPRLVQELSARSCREGESWGYDGRGLLWVDRGCRARFSTR